MNKVTDKKGNAFAPVDVLSKFSTDHLSESKCLGSILSLIHDDKSICPHCSSRLSLRQEFKFVLGERIKCRHCNKNFTALTNTFLAGIHASFSQIFLFCVLSASGLTGKKIASILGINRGTVYSWQQRFKGEK